MTKRVLIVDDALIMRMRIKEIALDSGWEIAGEAVNGEEGLARYRELRPDLMTLDIVMP
ncbi:MAG: response regulator, partial [Planctomycetales bacterium]